MKKTIYANIYTTVQNAMPMLLGNKKPQVTHEYYPTSTKNT